MDDRISIPETPRSSPKVPEGPWRSLKGEVFPPSGRAQFQVANDYRRRGAK